MSEVIRSGNIILKKDKIVSLSLKRNEIKVVTTISEHNYMYNRSEDAERAFNEFYEQLNEE